MRTMLEPCGQNNKSPHLAAVLRLIQTQQKSSPQDMSELNVDTQGQASLLIIRFLEASLRTGFTPLARISIPAN